MFMSLDRAGQPATGGPGPWGAGVGTTMALEPSRLVSLSECDVSPRLMSEYGSMLECELWCTDGCAGKVHRVLIDQEQNAPYLSVRLGADSSTRRTLVPMEWIGGVSTTDKKVYVNTRHDIITGAPAWDVESMPTDAIVVVDDYFERHAAAYDALACLF